MDTGEQGKKALQRVKREQELSEADQTAADADQTGSDTDQTASEEDQALSDRDQHAANREQRASDREQAASDRELADHPGAQAEMAHAAAAAEREAGTKVRGETTEDRAEVREGRSRQAATRVEVARRRDATAEERDRVADERDLTMEALERDIHTAGTTDAFQAALNHAAEARARAAEDRARAAEERKQAARDRAWAAEDRALILAELAEAQLDDLTGAYRRGIGERMLKAEIDRARRVDGRLVLAFIDVDDLSEINNREGHGAGDALLEGVVSSIRDQIRSYEPIVRFGGDEFVCAISGIDLHAAADRFESIRATLARSGHGGISVGLAELRPEDTLGDLIMRADTNLLDARKDPTEA